MRRGAKSRFGAQHPVCPGPHGSPVNDYLETEEKGIYAIGDLAFYPDRLMGGMRRQTHWENAREQGLVAGANMTGQKANPLRTAALFLDGDVRFATRFCR